MRGSVGLFIRLIAWLYDFLLVGVPVAVMSVTIFEIDVEALLFFVSIFLLYLTAMPVMTSGFTVGKRLIGIRIVSDCEAITWETIVLRHIITFGFYLLSGGILLLISFVMAMSRSDRRALHDCLAKTKVVYTSN